MTPQEIRLECLRLAVPRDIANPDTHVIVQRAKVYELFVVGEGQAQAKPASPPQQAAPVQQQQDRTRPQLQHPARK